MKPMKTPLIVFAACTSLAAQFVTFPARIQSSYYQNCGSASAANSGGWMPAATAPHDGTVVELMQTYGVAPWYGLFKWTKEKVAHFPRGLRAPFTDTEPSWFSAELGQSVGDSSCLFWRPYSGSGKYVDPTGGAQNSRAYWCEAMHRPVDKKTGYCK